MEEKMDRVIRLLVRLGEKTSHELVQRLVLFVVSMILMTGASLFSRWLIATEIPPLQVAGQVVCLWAWLQVGIGLVALVLGSRAAVWLVDHLPWNWVKEHPEYFRRWYEDGTPKQELIVRWKLFLIGVKTWVRIVWSHLREKYWLDCWR